MITRVFAAPARRDRPLAESLEHWRTVHAALARELPGLRRYVQYHPVDDDPGPWAVFSLLEFDDRAALELAFGLRGDGSAALAAANADEPRFLDTTAPSAGLVGERRRVSPSDPSGPAEFTVVVLDVCVEAGAWVAHERVIATPPPLPWDDRTWTTVDLVGCADLSHARELGGVVTRANVVIEGTG